MAILKLFVQFAKDRACELRYSPATGVGVHALKAMSSGSLPAGVFLTAVRGSVAKCCAVDGYATAGNGTSIGPVAFINSACRKCAGLRFTSTFNAQLMKKGGLAAGQQLLCHYRQGKEVFNCPVCSQSD
jgi:hypothetical protein